VITVPPESRADYFRERRKKVGQFSVPVDRKKLEKLSNKLNTKKQTKTAWLNEKIDEEIGTNEETPV
jgi:hypothetical protein